MKASFFKLTFLLILLLGLFSAKQVYLASVFRHGARYPLNDLYDGKQTKPLHGQLTSVGLRQQYLLGNYIQSDYANKTKLINKTLNPRQVQIFTLGGQRCQQSAYGHATGLFSFQEGVEIDPNIDPSLLQPPFQTIFPDNLKSQEAPSQFALFNGFQPVPIRPGEMFFPGCANQNNIFIRRGQKIILKLAELQAEFTVFAEQMRKIFNLTIAQTNIGGLDELYDTLVCDKYLGRPLPEKFKDSDFQKLFFIQGYLFTLVNEDEPGRIFNAPFIHQMIGNMQNVIKGKLHNKKLSSYSVHDSNIVPLLAYYNITSSDCLKKHYHNQTVTGNCAIPIPFASNLLFELHQNDTNTTNYFVKVRFNGIYYNLCGKNSTECQFSEFSRRSTVHLLDFDKQCAKPKSQFELQKQNIKILEQ